MNSAERKLNDLERLTRSPQFTSLPARERRRLLEDFYRSELEPAQVDRASFEAAFASAWQEEAASETTSSRKLNLTPLWWILGIVGGTAVGLTALVLWTNNQQDIAGLDDATLLRNLRAGDPVRQEEVALRRSLPDTGSEIWEVEKAMEQLQEPVRESAWQEAKDRSARVLELINRHEPAILGRANAQTRSRVRQGLADLRAQLRSFDDRLIDQNVSTATLQLRRSFWYLDLVHLALLDNWQPEIPEAYRRLPRLAGGWAMVRFETDKGPFTALLDGYNAPITAGNFLDLVRRGFYNGRPITRAERFNLVQTGDPQGNGKGGFVDPATGKLRTIPLEIRPARKEAEITASQIIERRVGYVQDRYQLDPLRLTQEMAALHERYIARDWQPVAYGQTLNKYPALYYGPPGVFSMARFENEPNSASSQFFISFSDPELNPTGNNLSDGKYANFGYITSGMRNVRQLKVGDRIRKAEILNCDRAEFNEFRELPGTGSAMFSSDDGPNTNIEMSCLPLPQARLVN